MTTTTPTSDTASPTDHDVPSATGRLRALHDDEAGAQAMEYTALAAGCTGFVGLLIALFESEPVQNGLRDLLTGVVTKIGDSVGGLLPFL
jgi:Flp pilus assembly pilin Flp